MWRSSLAYKLAVDSLNELARRWPEHRIGSEVVHEGVRVNEYRFSGPEVDKRHGLSCGSSAGSRAKRSSVAWSPFQPMIPYACTIVAGTDCTLTVTLSC